MIPRVPALPVVLAALLAGLLGLAGVGLAAPAQAHDALVGSSPADGATLDAAPTELTLTFSDAVLDLSLAVVVTGPDGEVPDVAPAAQGAVVTAALPADLPGGAYTVQWRVVSGDGHPVEGTFGFTVAGPTTEPTVTAEPTTATPVPDATASATAPAAASDTPAADTPPAGSDDRGLPAVAGWLVAGLVLVAAAALVARRTRGAGTRPPRP